jgi:hypothetical protein
VTADSGTVTADSGAVTADSDELRKSGHDATGIRGHDGSERAVTLDRKRRSRWAGIDGHFRPEYAVQELSRSSDTSPRAIHLPGCEGIRTIYPDGVPMTDPLSGLDFSGMGML